MVPAAMPRADHGRPAAAVPGGLTGPARSDWDALGGPTGELAAFDPGEAGGLPEPVRRWLSRAIEPGASLRSRVELRMRGEIRLGRWRPFTAVQRIGPDGFLWCARTRVAGVPVVGFDRYTRGSGQMRWRLAGAVPLVSADGPDVTRSAAGRLAGELLLAAPATALRPDVTWRGDAGDRATARVPVGDARHEVTLTMGRDGMPIELSMDRYGDPGDGFGVHRFGAILGGGLRCGGFTIPRTVRAGWFYGTPRWADGEFIRYSVESVAFR